MGQKSRDFCAAHIFGMMFMVKQNKATDPLDVGLLVLVRLVLNADGIADAIEQFLGGES